LLNRPNVDEIDVKIIHILQEDPRTIYLQLARDCNISNDSVRRRIERLKQEGIIVGEILSLHPKALGIACLAWLGIVTQPGTENEVLQSLRKKPEIEMNFVEIGKYNIRSILGVRHLDDLGPCVDSLKKIPCISDIEIMIWTDIQKMAYPGNLVIEPYSGDTREDLRGNRRVKGVWTSSTSSVEKGSGKAALPISTLCPSIDKLDESILNILLANARMPFSSVAKQVGVSTKTVIERYRKLKKEWVAYATLSLNLKKLGYSGYASFHVRVSPKSWVTEIFEKIVKIPNIIAALKLIGPYDINALSPFSTHEQLMQLYSCVSQISGIEKVDVQIGNSMDVWPGA
jgi:Lrp/AsnC family transcriptional regulator for asnA, asnC and gidA